MTAKRISIYLNEKDHARVSAIASSASLSIPGYLRRLALGMPIEDTSKDQTINGLANVARRVAAAMYDGMEKRSRADLEQALEQINILLGANLDRD